MRHEAPDIQDLGRLLKAVQVTANPSHHLPSLPSTLGPMGNEKLNKVTSTPRSPYQYGVSKQ